MCDPQLDKRLHLFFICSPSFQKICWRCSPSIISDRTILQVGIYVNLWAYHIYVIVFYWEICWYNYCTMLSQIIMMLECLVSNPLRKHKFHQDYIDFRSLIIIYVHERFFKFWCNVFSSLIVDMFCPSGTIRYFQKIH